MKLGSIALVMLMALILISGCASSKSFHGEKLPPPEAYNAHFGDMDVNGDGRVNWSEFKRHFPHAEPKVFFALDLNQDSAVDHDEWHQFKAAHNLKHKE